MAMIYYITYFTVVDSKSKSKSSKEQDTKRKTARGKKRKP